jgi:type IV pilus assembly protein PilY1
VWTWQQRQIEGTIMRKPTQQIKWAGLGFALAVLSGAPAIADDTELLLINPDPLNSPKPNVLFVIDTSGSMDTEEETNEPYDNSRTYNGDCNTAAIYWTDVDIVPECDINQDKFVMKNVFHCDYAQDQINGVGSFTNTMVQYRDGGKDGNSSGPSRWQYLAAGYNTQPVECQVDSGTHGDGRPTFLWAANGSNLADPFTDVEADELSWGSAPRNVSYTFYDGNYLNWKNNPTLVNMQRIDIVKSVISTVLSSVGNLNVGLMRFNPVDGGAVISALVDLDTNRQDLLNEIDGLLPRGFTPLSETLYESALYWRGMAAHYSGGNNTATTDPNALVSTNPDIYKMPTWDSCAKNFTVVLTDGEPTEDADTHTLAPTLPYFSDALGRAECLGPNEGDCLVDVAEYLFKQDIDPNTDGDQVVSTQTIGFAVNLDLLRDTADASEGKYFLADDVESLTRTLLTIISNISDRAQSFTAPAVSVNSFNRTQNLNDLYLTMFGTSSQVHWPGNLKKYAITNRVITDANGQPAVDPTTGFFKDTAQSFWTAGGPDGNEVRMGGAASNLPDPADRNLYTNNSGTDLTSAANQITQANAGAFTDADFGLTGAAGEPTKDQIIRWARGEDVRDEDNDPTTTKRFAMGDPLHSQPAALVYGGTAANPDVVVFTATNDGYLHAINASTGAELWSFVPKELLSNFTRLYFDPDSRYKQYGLDGSIVPVVKDANNNGIVDGSDFVYLIVGMRRGGQNYYALDVTNKTSPRILWQTSTASAGQSWSTPVVAKINVSGAAQNTDKAVVIVGGGYDPVHDSAPHPNSPDGSGAGITMLDLVSGAELWRAGPDAGADRQLTGMTRSIPNEIKVIDTSGDGLADRMYASDMGGQIWRFDIINGQSPANLVNGGVIAQLGAEGMATPGAADTRRFFNATDVSIFEDVVQDRRFIAISIGSGYRAHPYDLSAADRFYSIRDPDVFNILSQSDYDTYPKVTEANLEDVAGRKQVVIDSNDRGWMFTMPANQKVLADSVTFNDTVHFIGFSPDSSGISACEIGRGTNFLYSVSVVNGDPIVNNLEALDPADADDARRSQLAQGGIAPTPTVLFPSPDDADCEGAACSPPPIFCVGVECSDPSFDNNPVRTLWTQDGIE